MGISSKLDEWEKKLDDSMKKDKEKRKKQKEAEKKKRENEPSFKERWKEESAKAEGKAQAKMDAYNEERANNKMKGNNPSSAGGLGTMLMFIPVALFSLVIGGIVLTAIVWSIWDMIF